MVAVLADRAVPASGPWPGSGSFDGDLEDWRPVLIGPVRDRNQDRGWPAESRPAGRPERAVYLRRRLLVVGILLLATAAALVLVRSAMAGTGGETLTPTGAAAGRAASVSPAGATVYVVKPGDTLWSIAHALDPKGDERPLVARLAAELGGATLYPGETIQVPAAG